MERIKEINLELFLLKIDLNSNYGVGSSEVIRCERIFKRVGELRSELTLLNQNKEG